jgi:serine/threonine protein kinase
MLLNKVQVWSDKDIFKGTEWELLLEGKLNSASSALVLATPDYLNSSWCRHELQQLADAQRARRLRNVFWVQLKPCGWRYTELARFQALGGAAELAINDSPDENQRQRVILRTCEQIASEIYSWTTKQDKQLAFVRRLLSGSGGNITVTKVLNEGTFSISYLGSNGSHAAVIKVLKWVPMKGLTEDLLRISTKRMRLENPSFVHVHKVFPASDEEEEPRTVFVSDYVASSKLLSTRLQEKGPFSVDSVAVLLKRMAEGLAELHRPSIAQDVDPEAQEQVGENVLGLLVPHKMYYDEVAERLRVAPIGVSSFLWNVLGCKRYADWVDPKGRVYDAPERWNRSGGHLTLKTDQYMLGRLGVELLEGRCFEQLLEGKAAEQFSKDPDSFIKGPWRNNHWQLWNILRTMLREEPSERYSGMQEVVDKLGAVEEEGRALAKRMYRRDDTCKLKDNEKLNEAFFKQFYRTFIDASPASKKQFTSLKAKHHYNKLMMAMVHVLNFRAGNKPTSLDPIVETHRCKGISESEFDKFHESFLATIDAFFIGNQKIRDAWDSLLKPAIEYMKLECAGKENPRAEKPAENDIAHARARKRKVESMQVNDRADAALLGAGFSLMSSPAPCGDLV